MGGNELKPKIIEPKESAEQQNEIDQVRRDLLAAEAELAEEQAAVNAFRMHCRLKLDRWIERLQDVQVERQQLKTRLELLTQAEDYGIPFEVDDPFWFGEEIGDEIHEEEELLLPTDVPRDKEAEKRLYRQLARRFHPDLGLTAVEIAYRTEMMTAVNTAYEKGEVQTLYDLAGELDPQEMARLATIPSSTQRKMQLQLVHLKRRRRRAKRRLASLRQENTARLWRKARLLDQDDVHWWEIVRREIEQAITQIEEDIGKLQDRLEPLETSWSERQQADS
jgi:hypothetical protein